MPSNRSDFLVILSGVVGIVAGLFLAFYWLATTLTPAALAITLVLIVLGGLTFGAPLLWLIARLTRDRRAEAYRPDPPQLIDYAPATDYATARPRVVDVMRYSVNGEARPMLAKPSADVTLRTTTTAGEAIAIDAALAVRFAELATPSRSEWYGDRAAYGIAARWFSEHGMLDRDARGGYRWKDEYSDPATRVAFVRQFAGQVARTPARAHA